MVRVLVQNSYRVTVCCYYEYDDIIVEDFRSAGAAVRLLNLDRSAAPQSIGQLARLFQSLVKTLQTDMPDIVHVQYVAPGMIPILAAKLAHTKIVFATIHYPCSRFGKKERFLVRFASKLCTMFFCNSLATEKSWFGTGTVYGDNALDARLHHCTMYNSIDGKKIGTSAEGIHRERVKKKLEISRRPIVGVVARLRSEKGHSFLLQAMRLVTQSMPRAALVIIGDGPDKSLLEALAADLHLTENIRWLGSMPHEKMFPLYGIMDVVAVPSEYEGFGLSAAEAMAAGVPVVATDVGGLREVIETGTTGMLVPYGAPDKMAEAILILLRDPVSSRKMGRAGRKKMAEQFSLSKYSSLLIAAYTQYT